ncbi:MAG: hypothetical protein WCC14_09505 [Acidobacteriaceae bacterium]
MAKFVRGRLEERYFRPVDLMPADQKNGFLIMAVSCLTLEALESFRRGWPSTERHTKAAFRGFLERETRFAPFSRHAIEFYKHVRCGVLHQGETSGAWRIRRSGALFDESNLTVNATLFHRALHSTLVAYTGELAASAYRSPVWKNARKKLASILNNS